jgi:putative OPT family oligopeptide transporter
MAIGALLTPCNVYSGLKIGWTFNMSVAAGLIGFAFWSAARRLRATPPLGIHENNINQTAASSAASIISAGLAAPIPALALLTGQTLAYPVLALWLFVVSVLGVVVAAGLRNQLLLREHLAFPAGVVTAETMREIHGGGKEAAQRLRLLSLAGCLSAGLKFAVQGFGLRPLAPALNTKIALPAGAATTNVSAMNLGFALDPSVLMVGFGAIAGMRIGVSMLLGAVAGWALLAPVALTSGWAKPGPPGSETVWFGPLVEWLLWPGATLMTTASLTAFMISMARLALRRRERQAGYKASSSKSAALRALLPGFLVAALLSTAAQTAIFDIGLMEAVIAVLLSYVLAIVAARVSGETAITPIGALGKITQLTFGAISPGNVTANLMTANVTGGAAGQCADLMHDLRTGQMIGATPRFQIVAQLFGVLTGSLVAAITYILLIPDPQTQLITAEWPAPAVVTWKAVAEVLSLGVTAMPPAAMPAIVIASIVGVGLAIAESLAPAAARRFIPSAPAIGLGFVIPAWNSISLFLGAAGAMLVTWLFPAWAERRIVVIAAGLIVGESLAGVIGALASILG